MMGTIGFDSATEGDVGTPDGDRRRLAELNELAVAHCTDGRYEAALRLFEQVVAGCAAGLGVDDPDTLISHGNLVVTQLRLDPRGPGLAGLDANLAARRRVLGDRHPATLTAGRAQAVAYRRALAELEQALAEATSAAGPEHPDPEHPDTAQLRVELAELRSLAAAQRDANTSPVAAEAGTAPVVPEPRRPRGARFPRVR
jgi:hypothetical protein